MTPASHKALSLFGRYYRDARGALRVYDVGNFTSFDRAKSKWFQEFSKYADPGTVSRATVQCTQLCAQTR